MRLPVQNLHSRHTLVISATEPWLKPMATLLAPSAPELAQIQGEVILSTSTAGFVKASGHLTATAVQPCSLCGETLTFPLDTAVAATFRPPFEGHTPKEMTLISDDLEVYFIENGSIDLEVLINDALQCAMPYQVTCVGEGTGPCDNANLGSPSGQSNQDPGTNSPFAVLKTLK